MRTEDALKESEQRYATTLASIGDAVIATDTAGKITFMNAVAEELTGWTLSEAAMKPAKEVFNIINEHTRQRVEDPVTKVLENGVVVGLANHTILVRRNETEVAIDDSGAPIQDHDGNSLGVVLVFRDITERKRAEEELHASKERLSAILDQLPVGVAVADDSGQFILSNSIMRCYVSTMIPSRDPEHIKRWCSLDSEGHSIPRDQWPGARALRGETVSPRVEFIYTDDNGRESWVLVSAVPLRGAEEKITGAITVAQDITERRLNEEVLRKSKARFRSVLDNSRDTIYRLNLQTGLYEYISPSAEAVVGFSPDELMALDTDMAQAMIHPEDLCAMRAVAARLEEAGKGELEYRQRTKKGDYRWISNHMSLIKDKDGRPLYRDGNIRDITELKKVEEELQKTRDYLESLIDYANAPIIVLDPSFRITRFNHASERLTGTRAVEALGESLSVLFPEGSRDQSLDHIRRALTGEHWEAVEIPILKTDGSIRIVLWNSANIYAKNGTIIATIAQGQDITDRKLADEELRRARYELESRVQERTTDLSEAKEELECINKELQVEIEKHMQAEEALLLAKDAAEAAAQAKSDFMANMSHEIRTPMNAVIGMTSLLLDDEMLNPEQKDFVETIRMSGDALMVIINDILDFSKMQEDKVILEDQPFDLGSCVEEALDLVAQKASEKSLNLAYTIDKSVPDVIIGDPNRLRQILSNLLNNAIKFTEHGEIKLSVSGQTIEDYNEIHFEVQDTGIGISQDQMDRLFQPFSQVNNTMTRDYGGTGLGLVISKKLVELMGGKIWAKSELGKGSTFYFTIKAETAPGDEEEHLVGDQPQLVGKHVLIVNDNRTNRRILGAYLYSWGMIPMVAAKTEDALDWVRRGDTFDVAILDADMQDMAGPTLANEMRRYNKTLPLVMLTSIGRHLPNDHAYLTKPIKPSQLHRVLTNIISMQLAQKSERAEGINKEIQMSSLRILLAEDNVSSQKVAKQILKRLGYKADVVANGIEALQALQRQPYDLVLMDLKMPEMDGLQATRIIRQKWPDNGPKIIAVTAYALHGDKEKCIEAGMDDYISKPIKLNELAEMLRKYQTTEKDRVLSEGRPR